MNTSHEDQLTFFIISRSILLKIDNIAGKNYRENQLSKIFFRKCGLYEII